MKLAPMKPILELAEERNVAYGAFVTVSYEMARAAIEAGSELDVPVIFITGTDCVELLGGYDSAVETVKRAAFDSKVPVALHADHFKSYDDIVKAINAGYSSVMFDGSGLPFEENIKATKRVVDFAQCFGVTVEGELGRLVGEEGDLKVLGPEAAQTDPDEAAEFVERTGIDCLAVAIGTQHGHYTAAPHLNIDRLAKIEQLVNVPLVLHGGSGTPINQVQDAIRHGIRKINVATDVLVSVADSFETMKRREGFKYNTTMFINSKECAKEFIKTKMRQFRLETV